MLEVMEMCRLTLLLPSSSSMLEDAVAQVLLLVVVGQFGSQFGRNLQFLRLFPREIGVSEVSVCCRSRVDGPLQVELSSK